MLAPDSLMRPVPAVTVPPVGNAVGANTVVATAVGNTAGGPVFGNAVVGNSVRGDCGGAANAEAQSVALNRIAGHAIVTLRGPPREGVCRYLESFN
jgi:hypothetical protein